MMRDSAEGPIPKHMILHDFLNLKSKQGQILPARDRKGHKS